MKWQVRETRDKGEIQAYLEHDRLYAAYAIGDLAPALFEQCTWTIAVRAEETQALVLHFGGLEPPALFLTGATGGLRAILKQAPYPQQVYLTCRQEHLPVTREFFAWDRPIKMWRMILNRDRFRTALSDCVRLSSNHSDQLVALYAGEDNVGFSPAQIEAGVFYGIYLDGQLVATAGTHLVSAAYGVAAVGNVFTRPAHRGRGYGSATARAVVAELVRLGVSDIVLNVEQANLTAIRIYEKLGFERYCPFYEGHARRYGII
jgi:ribosomal protein S18 acetylase RimI-like enzyme